MRAVNDEAVSDGATFRFFVDSDDNGDLTVAFGSRRVSFVNNAERNIPKNFQETIAYVSETLQATSLVADEGSLTVFGESMHQHTIKYDNGTPCFLGFDVWSHEDAEWLRPDTARVTIERLGFETVPQYTDSTVGSFVPEVWDTPASHYRDGQAEGIVHRNTHTRARAKLGH